MLVSLRRIIFHELFVNNNVINNDVILHLASVFVKISREKAKKNPKRLQREAKKQVEQTKIEASANRSTFVWRGTLNYHLVGLLDTINLLYEKYNILIDENEYDIKYNILHAHMFVIEGMEKVRDIIEKNRLVMHKH